jgi:hypothetical protein
MLQRFASISTMRAAAVPTDSKRKLIICALEEL